MIRFLRLTALFCLTLSLSACVRTLTVESTIALPARAPVFVFPSVWVAGGKYEEEVYLLDHIAAHLARNTKREVRRVDAAELEPARLAGQISWLTAVVQLSLTLRSSERAYTDMVPTSYCGPFGCGMTSYQMYSSYIPVLSGEVVLTVHEGPTARVLSRETFKASVEGDAQQALRPELVERLADDLLRGVDVYLAGLAFKLQQTGMREADDGIAALSLGQHKQGRALLESAAKRLGGQKKETQARVLHALGVSRVLAPAEGTSDLSDALRALRLANSTYPRRLYSESITRVEALAKQMAVLAAQRAAERHNFELAAQTRAAPSAPVPAAPAPVPAK